MTNESAKARWFFLEEKRKKINLKVNMILVTDCLAREFAKEGMRLKPRGYLTKEATGAKLWEELHNLRYPIA